MIDYTEVRQKDKKKKKKKRDKKKRTTMAVVNLSKNIIRLERLLQLAETKSRDGEPESSSSSTLTVYLANQLVV